MAEFSDPNEGGLDATGAVRQRASLWKRKRAYGILIAFCAAILGMAMAAVSLLRSALGTGIPFEDRALNLVYGASLLLPLCLFLGYFVRLRVKTGRWRGTPEYIKRERAERQAKCSPATGCGLRKTGWMQYATKWATCAAMDQTLPMHQRIAAWIVLALYGLGMVALVGLSIICFIMASGVNDLESILVFIAAGLGSLLWPVMAVVKLVRGIRAGKVGATREDVEQIRAQRSAQHQREWQKPLRSKIISTGISCVVVAFWWMRVTLRHAQHPHDSWVGPAIATVPLLYSIWVQFRRPKNVDAPDGGSRTIEGS